MSKKARSNPVPAWRASDIPLRTPVDFIQKFLKQVKSFKGLSKSLLLPQDCVLTFEALVMEEPIPEHVGLILHKTLSAPLVRAAADKDEDVEIPDLAYLVREVFEAMKVDFPSGQFIPEWYKTANCFRANNPAGLADVFHSRLTVMLEAYGYTELVRSNSADAGLALKQWFLGEGFDFIDHGLQRLGAELDYLVFGGADPVLSSLPDDDGPENIEDTDIFESALWLFEISRVQPINREGWGYDDWEAAEALWKTYRTAGI